MRRKGCGREGSSDQGERWIQAVTDREKTSVTQDQAAENERAVDSGGQAQEAKTAGGVGEDTDCKTEKNKACKSCGDAAPQAEEDTSEAGAEEEAAEGGSPEPEEGKERKFFGRKKEKKDKKDEKIEELTDRLTRQMAEFDNFRKRTEKEKASMYAIGARDVIEKLLPVVDNFERGLAGADLKDPFAAGMDKVYKQMTGLLESLGVTAIESLGKEFDPNLHNAVMHVEDEEVGENVVVEEFQKGYKYKDSVVRHSMVKVAN